MMVWDIWHPQPDIMGFWLAGRHLHTSGTFGMRKVCNTQTNHAKCFQHHNFPSFDLNGNIYMSNWSQKEIIYVLITYAQTIVLIFYFCISCCHNFNPMRIRYFTSDYLFCFDFVQKKSKKTPKKNGVISSFLIEQNASNMVTWAKIIMKILNDCLLISSAMCNKPTLKKKKKCA